MLFTLGEAEVEAGPGDIIVVPAGAPHKFVSRGATHRQISIHPVAKMETEWWNECDWRLPPCFAVRASRGVLWINVEQEVKR